MEDIIDIIVTETTNTIEITAQPNDEIIDVNIIDNREDIVLNVTPTVVEININSLTSNFGVEWGDITGTLADQTDLNTVLTAKANLVDGKVPSSELPSYVDDVVEVATFSALPATGEIGKIYVILDTNKIYRWSGSTYIEIADSTAVWGAITGTLSSQTDLQNALNAKFDDPTGDTTQYIAGDGSLITFPVAGQSGTLVREVRNTTGATLTKGTIVYISGATGNKPTVSKAIATGDSTSAQTFGMCQANIANNSNGYVVCVGDLGGLDTSGLTEGAQLYLSSTTAGAYTTTKQLAPAHLVYIGVVTRAHPTLGQIEVKIQNGYELDEIHDVAISSLANNDGLFYESSTDLWKNKTIATVLGYTPEQPLTFSSPLSRSTNAVSIPVASSSVNGYLSSADWTTFNGKQAALSGTGFVKISGTTISYDNSTYALDSDVVKLTGAQTVAGIKTMSNVFKLDDTLQIKNIAQLSNNTGYTGVWAETAAIGFYTGANAIRLLYAGNYNYTMPSADGTLALTSQLSAYLPLSGGTLTGAVTGTRLVLSQNSADITLSIGNAGTGRAFSVLGTSYFSADIQLGYATNSILKTTALGFITSAIAGTDYQAPLSGTGFVKISGSTISYDNSTYLTTASASSTYLTIATASSTYLPLSGGTLTGALSGTSALFSGAVRANNPSEGATGEGLIAGQSFKIDGTGTSQKAVMYMVSNVLSDTYGSGLTAQFGNFAGDKGFGFNLNTSGGYELYVKNTTWNKALTIANTGAATFSGQVTSTTNFYTASISDTLGARAFGGNSFSIRNNVAEDFNIDIYNRTAGAWFNALKLANNGGAATFSSSVTAGGLIKTETYFNAGSGSAKLVGVGSAISGGFSSTDMLVYNTGGDLYLIATGAAGMFISGTNGNVGINTTSTNRSGYGGAKVLTIQASIQPILELVGSTYNAPGVFGGGAISFRNTSAEVGIVGVENLSGNAGNLVFFTNNGTTNAERMRITSSGFAKASNTSTYLGGTTASHHEISNLTATSGAINLVLGLGANTVNTSSYYLVCGRSGADNMYIYGNGNIVNTNGSYGTLSDSRLKENIVDATPKLADLLSVKIKNFNLIGDETKQIGIIAQELEEVFPSMVETDGKTGMKQVKTSVFIPMLIKAIQEQQVQIEELKNK